MECPPTIGSINPLNQTTKENASPNGQQTKTSVVAEVALNLGIETKTTPLDGKTIAAVTENNNETVDLKKGPLTIKIATFPHGIAEHRITDTIFNKAFYKKILAHLQDHKSESPLIQSDRDLRCVEYCFFQACAAKDVAKCSLLANLLKEQKPKEALTRLAHGYFLYLSCDNSSWRFPSGISTFLESIKTLDRNQLYIHELAILGYHLAHLTGDVEGEVRNLYYLFGIGNFNETTFAANCHRLDFIRKWIQLHPKMNNPVFEGIAQAALLTAEEKWSEALAFSEKMGKVPSSAFDFIIVRSLLKLNRVSEAEKFIKKIGVDGALFHGLVAAHKKNKDAFKYFERMFESIDHKKGLFYWVYLEICQLIKNFPNENCPMILVKALEHASEVQPNCLEIHETLLSVLPRYSVKEHSILIEKHSRHCARLNPRKGHKYILHAAKAAYNLNIDSCSLHHARYAKTILTEKYIKETQVDESDIRELSQLFDDLNAREESIDVLFTYYKSTDNDEVAFQIAAELASGKKKEAIDFLIQHASKKTASVKTLNMLARLLSQDSRNKEALQFAIQAYSLDNNLAKTQLTLALIHYQLNDFTTALKHFNKGANAIKISPQWMAYFDCCLECNQFKKAEDILKRKGSHIPDYLIDEYQQKLAIEEAKSNQVNPAAKAEQIENPTPTPSQKDAEQIDSATASAAPESATSLSSVSAAPEVVRVAERKQKKCLQSFSKNSVDDLRANKRLERWKANPSLLSNACTIDTELYGLRSKPAAAPSAAEDRTEVVLNKRLTEVERKRLERARQYLVQIGDLLAQEKDRTTPNPEDPGNFLFPRTLMYNVLKFCEALAPTGRNQIEISDEFKQIVQTHIISKKLILALRQAMRHEAAKVDLAKLKEVCHALKNSTVQKNIEAYMSCPVKTGPLDKSEAIVHFYDRTNIPKKQDVKIERKVDYLAEAQMELERMHKVGGKLSALQIDSEVFYKEGLKMALCNVEESLKRLDLPEDPELQDIFYYGNRFAHEMGSEVDPKLYYNEEIQIERLYRIITKAEKIKDIILRLAKKNNK